MSNNKHGEYTPCGHCADTSHLVWQKLGSRKLFRTRIFSLREDTRRSPEGKEASFVAVNAPDWVTVIPELEAEDAPETGSGKQTDAAANPRFLIVRQFRHGTEKVGLEFPAGVIDRGESPEQAARRELLEETGYEAGELCQIGAVSPNPAFMSNTTYTFVARGLRRASLNLNLDEHELLDVCTRDFRSLSRSVGQAPFDSAITVQAWYFYLRERMREKAV